MLTLADIQTPQFNQAAGFCPTESNFLELLNDTVQELMRRGDWDGTIVPVRVCVKRGCVTWPRYVSQVRKLNTCAASAPVQNVWYAFMEHGHERGPSAWYNTWPWRGSCIDTTQMLNQGRAPTYNDVYGTDCYLRVYPMAPEDAGKTVTVFGLDGDGNPLMTRDETTGEWSEGIVITIPTIDPDTAYGSSAVTVSRIDRIVKEVTQNGLRLYAYDSVNDWLFDLATYEPSETNPSYLRYYLSGCNTPWNYAACRACCESQQSVVALVKLKQLPIKVSTDLILIDNRRTLLNGIRAMKSEEAGNIPQANGQWAVAIEGLNRQLEDSAPDASFATRNNVLGGRVFTNQAF